MDFAVLNRGEKIAGVAGVLLILIMFIFDWFGVGVAGLPSQVNGIPTEVTGNAWDAYGFTDIILFLTALAAIGLAVMAASDAEVGLPVAMSAIVTALGILSLILVLISIISPPDFGAPDLSGLDHSRKIGVWLGLLAVIAVTAGGFLAMQEEGTTFAGEADRFRGGGSGGGGAGGPGAGPPSPPPPPPPSEPPSVPPPSSGPPPPSGQ
jgi:hypothetical protein